MTELTWKEENNAYWNRVNRARREFQDFINYEWNYAVHISFHKNYDSDTNNANKLVRAYLNYLRRNKKLTFSSFYIIPKSFIDPYFKPHHIHILMLIFNETDRMQMILKDATIQFPAINKCEVHQLYMPEASRYLTKFKNLNLTDLDSFYFDFYREKLLEKYGNQTGYIYDELMMAIRKKYNTVSALP